MNQSAEQLALYKHAQLLYTNKSYSQLEKVFAKYLKRSYDILFWELYIEYVRRVSVKKVNLVEVYLFVLGHFSHSYFAVRLHREYIGELIGSTGAGSGANTSAHTVERVRAAYTAALSVPMEGLPQLFSEYERWEQQTSRAGARALIEQVQPAFSAANAVYQRVAAALDTDDFYTVLDVETENPLHLSRSSYNSRLTGIFSHFLSRLPRNEPLLFLQSFYKSKEGSTDITTTTNTLTPFLSVWNSYALNKNLFNFDDSDNFDLICIHHLSWLIKNSGIQAFRLKFTEVKNCLGIRPYIFAAHIEFYLGNSKENAYQIMLEAYNKTTGDANKTIGDTNKTTGDANKTIGDANKTIGDANKFAIDSPLVSEHFFNLFISIGDDDNIRPLFKKLNKTIYMWNKMIEYEFIHGEIEEYKSLIVAKQDVISKQDNPDGNSTGDNSIGGMGSNEGGNMSTGINNTIYTNNYGATYINYNTPFTPLTILSTNPSVSKGSKGIYQSVSNSLSFLGLKFKVDTKIEDFIQKLPKINNSENILFCLNNYSIIELLQEVKI